MLHEKVAGIGNASRAEAPAVLALLGPGLSQPTAAGAETTVAPHASTPSPRRKPVVGARPSLAEGELHAGLARLAAVHEQAVAAVEAVEAELMDLYAGLAAVSERSAA